MTHITDTSALLPTIEAFLTRTGMSPSRFGELSVNDRAFVADLRKGDRELKPSTIKGVLKWMEGYDAGRADGVKAA